MPSATAARPWPDVSPVHPPGRIGLIGAGAFGRFCLDAYQSSGDVAVVAVADPSLEALSQIRSPGIRRERDWHSLLANDVVEVIHLATPPDTRSEMALAALDARKSVFSEKPLALSVPDADAIIAAAIRTGAAVAVNYIMRHHPAYHLLETLASSLPFGSLRTISLENYAQAVPRGHWFWDRERSGGILVEHGVHFFDVYGQIAGRPVRVWGSNPRPEAVEITVQYTNGVLGRFYHEFAFSEEVEQTVGRSVFERGYIEIRGWIPIQLTAVVLAPMEEVEAWAAAVELSPTLDENGAVRLEAFFGNRTRAYQAAIVSGMRDLLHRHRNPAHQMRVSVRDARESLAMAIAAQVSADTGQTVDVAAQEAQAVAREPT